MRGDSLYSSKRQAEIGMMPTQIPPHTLKVSCDDIRSRTVIDSWTEALILVFLGEEQEAADEVVDVAVEETSIEEGLEGDSLLAGSLL